MILLYCFIFLLLIVAISLLATACRVDKISWDKFLLSSLFIACISLSLYQFSGNKIGLNYWLTRGKEHYLLMQQFQALGGLDGMIAKVKQRLAENPNDMQGQEILKKLLAAKKNSNQG